MPKTEHWVLRLLKKTKFDGDCWIFTGALTNGYGKIYGPNKKYHRNHRLSYETFVGEIPKGLVIDHICRNTACFNPKHLRPLTDKENILIGIGPTAVNAKKTRCRNGHKFTKANTYRYGPKNNYRGCKICRVQTTRIWRSKNKYKEVME